MVQDQQNTNEVFILFSTLSWNSQGGVCALWWTRDISSMCSPITLWAPSVGHTEEIQYIPSAHWGIASVQHRLQKINYKDVLWYNCPPRASKQSFVFWVTQKAYPKVCSSRLRQATRRVMCCDIGYTHCQRLAHHCHDLKRTAVMWRMQHQGNPITQRGVGCLQCHVKPLSRLWSCILYTCISVCVALQGTCRSLAHFTSQCTLPPRSQ